MSEQVSQESKLHKEYDALYSGADPTKDHPVYWHWLEQRIYTLEAKLEHFERFKLYLKTMGGIDVDFAWSETDAPNKRGR